MGVVVVADEQVGAQLAMRILGLLCTVRASTVVFVTGIIVSKKWQLIGVFSFGCFGMGVV